MAPEIIKILLIFGLVLFNGFLLISRIKIGMTDSISALHEEYEARNKAWVYVASFFAFTIPVLLTAQSHFITAAGVLILCSALAGDTDEHKIVMRNHVIYSLGGMILGFAGLIELGMPVYGLVGGGVAALPWLLKIKDHTYFSEWIAFNWILIIWILQ